MASPIIYPHLDMTHPITPAEGTTRKQDIDIARGIAIFSVVFAHIVTGFTSQVIYLFHMPFFFIVSGYLHKVNPQEGRYFKRKCCALLLPYIVYLYILELPLLSKLLARIIENPSTEGIVNFGKMLLKLLYGGETLRGATGVFWFVTCLFLVQQLFNFLSNRIHSKRLFGLTAFGFYVFACIDQMSPVHLAAPFAANIVACAFGFYAIGAFFGPALFTTHSHRSERRIVAIAISITLLSALLLSAGLRLEFDMKHGYYGYAVLSPLAAIAMTKLLMVGSHMLTKYQRISQIITLVGTASITIMYVHLSLEMALPEILYKVPLIQAAIITALCCLLHTLFNSNRWTKLLFLGQRLNGSSKQALAVSE